MTLSELIRQLDDGTTLDMSEQTLDGLEIRPGTDKFHYFYDTTNRRLIKNFRLDDGPRVALYCDVQLIAHGDKYSPRIRLWKRDKTKRAVLELAAGDVRGGHIVKALVDLTSGHENFLKLMAWVVNLATIEVSGQAFRMIDALDAEVVEALKVRSRKDLVPMIQSALDGRLTEAEIVLLGGRKEDLEEFRQLLHVDGCIEKVASDEPGGVEAVWQRFFEKATWIFGYGLNFVSHAAMSDRKLEQITVGNNVWNGAGKRIDALMQARAQISTLLFCEIKKHDTALLQGSAYREPDVYAPSKELVGGVAQLQKTVRKSLRLLTNQVEESRKADGTPTGIDFSTTRPRQVLVIGRLSEFQTAHGVNGEKMESFELYRKSQTEVEVITFDELYERAKFIVGG